MANRIFCYLQQEFLSQLHLENRFDIMITENGGKLRYFHSIYHLCNRNAKVEWKKNGRTDQSKIPCNAQTSSKWATPINFAEKFMDQNGRILRFNIVSRPMILYTTSLLQIFIRSKPMQSQCIFTFKLTAKIYENRKPCVNDVVRERTNNCWLGNITDSNETPCFISFTLNGRYQCWKFILYWSELHETNFFSSLIYVPFFWHNAAHKFVARSQYMFFCFYFCYVYIIHQNILLIHVYSLRFELFN